VKELLPLGAVKAGHAVNLFTSEFPNRRSEMLWVVSAWPEIFWQWKNF
jgi:hypothetical protein